MFGREIKEEGVAPRHQERREKGKREREGDVNDALELTGVNSNTHSREV